MRCLNPILAAVLLGFCSASCRDSGDRSSVATPVADSSSRAAASPEIRPADGAQVLAAVRAAGSRAVLVNVWATWCAPCREEFPDLVRLGRTYKDQGLAMVFVSADWDEQLPEAKKFLAEHGVDVPSYVKTGDDMKFINALSPRWSGALPATFLYDGEGKLVYFRQGKATYALLEGELLKILKLRSESSKEEKT